MARCLGLSVSSVCVPWSDIPGSKVRWHTPLSMLLDVLRVALLYRSGVWRLDCWTPAINIEEEKENQEQVLSSRFLKMVKYVEEDGHANTNDQCEPM